MEHPLTISISLIRPLFYYAAQKGIRSDDILSKAGIDPICFESLDSRVSIDIMDRIYKQTMQMTKDDHLGLHVGEFFAPGSANIVGHILMNCQTGLEVLEKAAVYNKILSEDIRVEVKKKKQDQILIQHTLNHFSRSLGRQYIEFAFSSGVKLMSVLLGKPVSPVEVRFQHPSPGDTSEHQRIFNADLKFESSMNAVVYDGQIEDCPVHQPNPELLFSLELYAKKILNDIQADKQLTKKVSILLTGKFQERLPTIKQIAGELSMSIRNLQRNLEKESTSYSEIFNEVYEKLAISYLMESEMPISEIAYIMGFSEPSAFHRSFKRWTGMTPSKYRSQK